MRSLRIKAKTGCHAGARQHRLAKAKRSHRNRIETREWMERITLEIMAFGRGPHEAMIEMRIVTNENRAFAALSFHTCADVAKHVAKYILLGVRDAQGMMRIYAGEFKCGLFEVRACKWNDPVKMRGFGYKPHVLIDAQDYGGYLKNSIGLRVEAATFNVNNHRQEAAKTLGYKRRSC